MQMNMDLDQSNAQLLMQRRRVIIEERFDGSPHKDYIMPKRLSMSYSQCASEISSVYDLKKQNINPKRIKIVPLKQLVKMKKRHNSTQTTAHTQSILSNLQKPIKTEQKLNPTIISAQKVVQNSQESSFCSKISSIWCCLKEQNILQQQTKQMIVLQHQQTAKKQWSAFYYKTVSNTTRRRNRL